MGSAIVRILCFLLSVVVGIHVGNIYEPTTTGMVWGGFIAACAAGAVIGLEMILAKRRASLVPTLWIGILMGLLLGPQLAQPVLLIPGMEKARDVVTPFLTFLVAYLVSMVIYRTKDEFKFSIPYVEFRRQGGGTRPLILDTSAIIDARFVEVARTGIVDAPVVVPRFVLHELQGIADSSDRLRRNRGRRGLDALQKLREIPRIEVRIDESQIESVPAVDAKLVALAKSIGGRLVSTDFNLKKVAELQEVQVVNLNEIAEAVKPAVLPGEPLSVRIVKPGEGAAQGVGYLDDGTMVVVEGARGEVGHTVSLTVTSSLQTHAGRMIFGRMGERLAAKEA